MQKAKKKKSTHTYVLISFHRLSGTKSFRYIHVRSDDSKNRVEYIIHAIEEVPNDKRKIFDMGFVEDVTSCESYKL